MRPRASQEGKEGRAPAFATSLAPGGGISTRQGNSAGGSRGLGPLPNAPFGLNTASGNKITFGLTLGLLSHECPLFHSEHPPTPKRAHNAAFHEQSCLPRLPVKPTELDALKISPKSLVPSLHRNGTDACMPWNPSGLRSWARRASPEAPSSAGHRDTRQDPGKGTPSLSRTYRLREPFCATTAGHVPRVY